jgi:hypothetical protein
MVLQKIMDVSMSEIIRETRNAINSRLDMLEVLVTRSHYSAYSNPMSNSNSGCDNHRMDTLFQKMETLDNIVLNAVEHFENKYSILEEKLNNANANAKKLCDICKKNDNNCYCDMPLLETLPLASSSKFIPIIENEHFLPEIIVKEEEEEYSYGNHIKYGDDALSDMKSREVEIKDNKILPIVNEVVEEEDEEEAVEEAVEEVVEEEDEEVVEEEVVEEEEEEAVEEEAVELEEFEYKGMTLYRAASPDNKVYRMDEDGCISMSDPIGIWDEKSKKIKKL